MISSNYFTTLPPQSDTHGQEAQNNKVVLQLNLVAPHNCILARNILPFLHSQVYAISSVLLLSFVVTQDKFVVRFTLI